MKNIRTVILYVRESTPGSAQSQLNELNKYCRANRISPLATYIDEGCGIDNAIFMKIMDDINSGEVKVDAVLFTKWKVFSESHDTAIKKMRQLRQLGVKCMTTDKQELIIPIFKMDNLVHHSDYIKVCGERHSSTTTNMDYVTCKKCLALIDQKAQSKK